MKRGGKMAPAPKGTGSRPEKMDFGEGDWVARNYTAKEVDEKGQIKAKVCLPDQASQDRKYRENYEKAFGHE